MARGRMLNKSVCASRKFNDLSDDTCRLLATWTIANLDCFGVFYGDPAMIRSYVFPRRCDLSVEQIDGYLQELVRAGLVVLFNSKGDTWQWWPGFADNQVGLRAERESTGFPPPPEQEQEGGRQDDGKMPDEWRQDDGKYPAEEKGREVNRREGEGNGSEERPPFCSKHQVAFTRYSNQHGAWWSHRQNGGWCKWKPPPRPRTGTDYISGQFGESIQH